MRMMRTAVTALLAFALAPLGVEAAPRITAKAAVIMDAETGVVLWERDANRALPPASTTKSSAPRVIANAWGVLLLR